MSIFKLPDLGEGLAEAEINSWYVEVGTKVKIDEPLVAVETAKALVDIPSPFNGKITKLMYKAGDIVPTGSTLLQYEDKNTASKQNSSNTVVGQLNQGEHLWQEAKVASEVNNTNNSQISPALRNLAKSYGLDINTIKGSGPNNTINKQDIETANLTKNGIPIDMEFQELHGVRRSMAKAMEKSKTSVVPVTLVDDAILTNFSDNYDLSVNLMLAIATACKEEPNLNSWFLDNLSIHKFNTLNLGIAVDTEDGLFVPVIKDINGKDNKKLRAELNQLKSNIKNRTIDPQILKGASFTLSNFGTFSGRYASPIVVPPQVGILASGKLRQEAIVVNDDIEIRYVLPLSLTFDHRAATGSEAAKFLKHIIDYLEQAS